VGGGAGGGTARERRGRRVGSDFLDGGIGELLASYVDGNRIDM